MTKKKRTSVSAQTGISCFLFRSLDHHGTIRLLMPLSCLASWISSASFCLLFFPDVFDEDIGDEDIGTAQGDRGAAQHHQEGMVWVWFN